MWSQFDHDPRASANAAMRASDRDRAVIETVLADAFAEGRITRAEYDERTDAALASRTLGELVPLVSDLPAAQAPRSTPVDLRQQAVRKWESERREAVEFTTLDEPDRLVEAITDDAAEQDAVLGTGDPRNAIVAAWLRFEVQGARAGRPARRRRWC